MSENKHTPVETFDCQGCRPYCYGGYHMEADKDGLGDYVKAEDYRAVEKQRDDLLAALEKLAEVYDAMGAPRGPSRIIADAAIASVKGGAV